MKSRFFVIWSVLVVLAGLMLFAGCGNNSATTASGPAKKIIRVGTSGEYYPLCFKKNNQLQGFEIDVWNEIGKRAGYEIEFKVSKFAGLFGMLDAGQIDTIAHIISTTEERQKKYDFSETYAYSTYQFTVKKDSQLTNLEDFKGKKIGVWLGSNAEKTLKQVNEKYQLNMEIVTYDGSPMEKEVEVGRLDATWSGAIKAKTTIEQGNLNLRLAAAKTGIGEINQYPFVKNEKNNQLIEDVNKAIKSMHEDGTLTKLSLKWFGMDTTKPQ
ncbi:putative amino-acid-binding protein YxeM precursor [Sporomusa ovata DSM 2662]|uniref:Amino acid ABC transporter, periplasmic amino acid-binding portion n=3 Tax=Sporomusa ovata TaxID=2378 RepID=A0A0U1KUS1_9FIRM|nr:transporter substrate-binding domain-containing protein [Sporomusa ovata]CQR71172.1 Amino acid ABC transporter, periplasmic amino acid-binding portion [Sporomusa ovata]